MVARAPMAADSVGVAHPADIEATTIAKIDTRGTTYWTNGRIFSHPSYSTSSLGGARRGSSFTRTMM